MTPADQQRATYRFVLGALGVFFAFYLFVYGATFNACPDALEVTPFGLPVCPEVQP